MLKGRYVNSYPFVKIAFELKSEHTDAQTNLIANLSNLISTEISSMNSLADMDTLVAVYPILLENNNFIMLCGACQLKCIEEMFKTKG